MEFTIIIIEAAFFFAMGVVALIKPALVVQLFGESGIGADMRNEVRAVYGGFGIAIACTLVASIKLESIREGVYVTVAAALLGMAFGRIISRLIEKTSGPFPTIFLTVEVILASGLLYVCGAF